MNLPDIELVAAQVHAAWMAGKRAKDIHTRKAEDGEELMVPYADLSEAQKEQDRSLVRTVYQAINVLEAQERVKDLDAALTAEQMRVSQLGG